MKKRIHKAGWWMSLALFLLIVPLYAHPGGLDVMGGHIRASDSTYHFHKGILKRKTFANYEDASTAFEAVSKALPVSNLTVASFNIRVFTNNSRTDAELDKIVDILKEFDIIAIQETRDTTVIERTVQKLDNATGTDWDYEISTPVGWNHVYELYVFLYRKNKVSVKEHGKLADDPEDVFSREPYYATFQSGHFDFTLISFHSLPYGHKVVERKKELDKLAETFINIQNSDPHEQDIILMGDLNDPPTNKRFKSLNDIDDSLFLFQPPDKTTVKDKSLYDNIMFQKGFLSEYTGEHDVVKFDETLFHNDYGLAQQTVSDHRPIYAVFRTDTDDD